MQLIGKVEPANDHSKEPCKGLSLFFSPWKIGLILSKMGFAEKGVSGVGVSFCTHINTP